MTTSIDCDVMLVTNCFIGTELLTGSVGHACPASYTGSSSPTHGSSTLPSPPIRRQHEFLLLFPYAFGMVQARI